MPTACQFNMSSLFGHYLLKNEFTRDVLKQVSLKAYKPPPRMFLQIFEFFKTAIPRYNHDRCLSIASFIKLG